MTPEQRSPSRSERADAVTVLLLGAAAVVVIAWLTTARILTTFRSDGIAWTLPIDQQPIEATIDAGATDLHGYATQALVIAPGVDAMATAAIVASIVVGTLTALTITAGVMWIAWSFLRGRVFAPATARAFDLIGWTLVVGTLVALGLDTVGRNGVTSALGAGPGEPLHPAELWLWAPVCATGIAVGLLGRAFRRGVRLQKDTEGLV
ncbi:MULTISPECIES: hypothetical protein [Microbacterium]|uniref:hypothetical protein n=1 Tax=Microbacterium TaxID=33882 RepID=UPI00300FF0DF